MPLRCNVADVWITNRRHQAGLQALRDDIEGIRSELRQLGDAIPDRVRGEVGPAADRALGGILERIETARTETEARIDGLHAKITQLTVAIDEGIARTDRSERRVRAVVKRARQELADLGYSDEGLEAEHLQLVDGEGGEGGGVQPLRDAVARPDEQASSVRGVPLSVLRKVRGL